MHLKNKTHILLVDDEPEFIETIGTILRSREFEVETATSGPIALELFARSDFDLVITDINMRGMDGIELIRRLRQAKPEQRVIVVTGFPSHESQEEAFKLGSLNYIVKPFSTERFLELVRKSINEEKGNGLVGPVQLTTEDLVQMYALDGKSVILEIRKGKNIGHIYFEKGKVIHAETDLSVGEEAFYEIQSWKDGVFKAEPFTKEVAKTIKKGVDALLIEGARIMDEQTRSGAEKISETTQKKEDSMPSPVQQILDEAARQVDGLVAAGVVGMDGIHIAQFSRGEVPREAQEAYGVKFALVMSLVRKTLTEVGGGELEENLVEHSGGWFLTRFVGKGNYYLGMAVAKDAVLGNVRMVAKQTAEKLSRVIG